MYYVVQVLVSEFLFASGNIQLVFPLTSIAALKIIDCSYSYIFKQVSCVNMNKFSGL